MSPRRGLRTVSKRLSRCVDTPSSIVSRHYLIFVSSGGQLSGKRPSRSRKLKRYHLVMPSS